MCFNFGWCVTLLSTSLFIRAAAVTSEEESWHALGRERESGTARISGTGGRVAAATPCAVAGGGSFAFGFTSET